MDTCFRQNGLASKLIKNSIDEALKMKSIAGDEKFNYKLVHTYDREPNTVYLESNIVPEVMDLLIAHIQYQASNFAESYSFDQVDAANIIGKLYNGKVLHEPVDDAYNIDLYVNWELYCGYSEVIEKIEVFKHENLEVELLQAIPEEYIDRD